MMTDEISDILRNLGINEENIKLLPLLKICIEKLNKINRITNLQYQKIEDLINKINFSNSIHGYKTKFPILAFNYFTQNSKYYEKWGWDITTNLVEIEKNKTISNKNKIYQYSLTLIKFFNLIDNLEKEDLKFEYKNFLDFRYFRCY